MKILVLLGGKYHDFEKGGEIISQVLSQLPGVSVEKTWSTDKLLKLDEYKLLVIYTQGGELEEEKAEALEEFVKSGGGVIGVHCATDSFKNCEKYLKLIGGVFETHSPYMEFQVRIVDKEHPVTSGVADFTIKDELYVHKFLSPVKTLAVAEWQGKDQPVMWVREVGEGRIFYTALGHSPESLENPSLKQVLLKAAKWALKLA